MTNKSEMVLENCTKIYLIITRSGKINKYMAQFHASCACPFSAHAEKLNNQMNFMTKASRVDPPHIFNINKLQPCQSFQFVTLKSTGTNM